MSDEAHPTDEDAPAGTAAREDEVTPGAPSRAAFVLAVSLAVLFALVAAVLGVLLAGDAGDDGGADEVRTAAGRFAEVAFSYDYRDPDDNRRRVAELSTPGFEEDYSRAFAGLKDLVEQVESSSRASVNDVYVAEVDGSSALAVASVNLDLEGSAGPRTIHDVYIRIEMQRLDGDWKVDDLAAITVPGATGGGQAEPDAGASTTTAAPSQTPTTPVP